MYGNAARPEFTGLEGPDDPSHAVLAVNDAEGKCMAIVHNNCCHATCLEGAMFASADFPGEARRLIREAVSASIAVLYLQGASGDTSPWNMLKTPSRYSGEQRVREIGATLAAETLRLLREAPMTDAPILRHAFEQMTLTVRLPSPEQVKRAEEIEAQGEAQVKRWDYVLAVCGVLRLQREFASHPHDTVPVHAVRVGDLAIVTNPCELYCQFGLDIKRRSPAPMTMIAQLAGGRAGYCPTIPGQLGGGYSGDAIYWSRLEPYAGYKIVEASARLANGLWRSGI